MPLHQPQEALQLVLALRHGVGKILNELNSCRICGCSISGLWTNHTGGRSEASQPPQDLHQPSSISQSSPPPRNVGSSCPKTGLLRSSGVGQSDRRWVTFNVRLPPLVPEGTRRNTNSRWSPGGWRSPNCRPTHWSRFDGDVNRARMFPSGAERTGLPRPASPCGWRH